MAITIDAIDLEEILIEIGYPILDIADLPYTEQQIKDHFITPVMREYFKYFPIEDQQEYSIGTSFEIDFPDAITFNVIDARLNSNIALAGQTADPFVNSMNLISIGSSGGRYGTPYNYGLNPLYHAERASYRGQLNSQNAFKVKVDTVNRKVKGFSNIQGKLIITWAKMSENYSDIPLDHKEEVKKYAGSKILRGFGNIIAMQSSQSSINELDSQHFLDRADELRDEVLEKWKGFSKIVVLRN